MLRNLKVTLSRFELNCGKWLSFIYNQEITGWVIGIILQNSTRLRLYRSTQVWVMPPHRLSDGVNNRNALYNMMFKTIILTMSRRKLIILHKQRVLKIKCNSLNNGWIGGERCEGARERKRAGFGNSFKW